MYKSPIEMLVSDIQNQIVKQQDEEIYKAVVNVGINVDKDELIRALKYDRMQYTKGYQDGVADATPRWFSVEKNLPNPFETVWVYDKTAKRVTDAYLTMHLEWVGVVMSHEITHWMAMPAPPEEVE